MKIFGRLQLGSTSTKPDDKRGRHRLSWDDRMDGLGILDDEEADL